MSAASRRPGALHVVAPRRPRVDAAQRRAQLVDVAADIVAAGGVRALSIEAVVAKAGVHRPVLYRHFPNADALLDAVLQRELTRLRAASADAVDGIEGFEPRIRAAVEAWMEEFARAPRLMAAALVRAPGSGAQRTRRAEQQASSMRFLVGELEGAGLTSADAELAAAALLHALVGVVALWGAKRIDRRTAIDRYVRMVVATAAALQSD